MSLHLPWPLPAVLTWALAWVACLGAMRLGLGPGAGLTLGLIVSLVGASAGVIWRLGGGPRGAVANARMSAWRRALVLLGFPLSALLFALRTPGPHAGAGAGAGTTSPALEGLLQGLWQQWPWLLALAVLAAVYPWRTWRDAPLFPTPRGALEGLQDLLPLSPSARILDGGCGLGDGLVELRRVFPQAHLVGLEWSRPLALACAWRMARRGPRIEVKRGDLWAENWSAYDLVYLFQRPESMHRAVEKARRELRPGACLVSLEFEPTGASPLERLEPVPGKPVWVLKF